MLSTQVCAYRQLRKCTGALERRREGEHHLLDYVECEARDLSGEPFTRFMQFLYGRIKDLVTRQDLPFPGHCMGESEAITACVVHGPV